MAARRAGHQPEDMPVVTPELTRPRVGPVREDAADPAHAAYGHAATMLASAQALEAATHPSGAVPATPATLACLETSLDALSLAVARLRAHALERLADPVLPGDDARPRRARVGDDARPRRARVAADLAQLAGTLEQAASACAHARHSLAPVAGELAG
jgi:hypothetical protein